MYRASLRSSAQLARAAIRQPLTVATHRAGARRLASTASPASRGSRKGSLVRWGLAIGALYWYNTSPIFADDATAAATKPLAPSETSAAIASTPAESEFRTVDFLLEEKQKQQEAEKKKQQETEEAERKQKADRADKVQESEGAPASSEPPPVEGSPEALEAEASQQGAFNPETGEINWDCPCLGGMADGPCGEDFKAAFSCFVYSAEEPKGMDCIDKFQHMQDCFRKYPEIYGAEIDDDQDGEAGPEAPQHEDQPPSLEGVPAASESADVATSKKEEKKRDAPAAEHEAKSKAAAPESTPVQDDVVQAEFTRAEKTPKENAKAGSQPVADEGVVPTAAFDATRANKA